MRTNGRRTSSVNRSINQRLLRATWVATALVIASALAVSAAGHDVAEWRQPTVQVDSDPTPDYGFELPPSAYPLIPVEQDGYLLSRPGKISDSQG